MSALVPPKVLAEIYEKFSDLYGEPQEVEYVIEDDQTLSGLRFTYNSLAIPVATAKVHGIDVFFSQRSGPAFI